LDEATPVLGAVPAGEANGVVAYPREVLEADGARLVVSLGEGALATRKQDLGRALVKASARVARRIEARRGDAARTGQARGLSMLAALMSTEDAKVPGGATRIVATDWSSGEPRPVELPLDPSRSARDQVDALFKRAKRLKLGAAIAEKRLAEAERAKEALTGA